MQKRIKEEKNGDKDGNQLHELINNDVYSKTMDNFRNRIDVRLKVMKKTILNRHQNQPTCHKKYVTIIQSNIQ